MALGKRFNLLIIVTLFCSGNVFASAKLDPFVAEFTVLSGNGLPGADVAVTLDFSIHNDSQNKLMGSKFICMEDIESVSVTDEEGKELPFTIKKYPRKRIIWEYAAAEQGSRRTKIKFIMKEAVRQQDENLEINIDWIGGWKRRVLNAHYTIILPGEIDEEDIVSVYPPQFSLNKGQGRTKISLRFAELTSKALSVVLKKRKYATVTRQDTGDNKTLETAAASAKNEEGDSQHALPEKPQQQEKQAGKTDNTTGQVRTEANSLQDIKIAQQTTVVESPRPEKEKNKTEKKGKAESERTAEEQYVLKKIRYAPYDDFTDRVVFDFNKKVPYKITYDTQKDEVAIAFTGAVEVTGTLGKKNSLSSQFIKGLYWEKDKNKKLSCILRLTKKNMKVRYGTLRNPPRIYIDLFQKKMQTDGKKDSDASAKDPSVSTGKQNNAVLQKPKIKEQVLAAPATVSTTTTAPAASRQDAPIEEKIAYRKSRKFFKIGNYLKAVEAYEEFLRIYPKSVLNEKVFFEIADSYYKKAEEEPNYYTHATDAYKTAVAKFPQSKNAPQAAFQIAEADRKRNLFIEAKSRYLLVIKKYPQDPVAVTSRFWIAECLYQMKDYTKALEQFLRYVDDYSSGPYQKEATYRIGDCYFQVKDFDRAEFYYEKAIRRWPDLSMVPVDSLNNLATTDYYQGNFERCREAFFISYNLYPSQLNKERLLRFIGDAYQWEGEMQKALNIYGLLVRFAPDSYEAMIAAMRIADLGVNVEGLQAKDFIFHTIHPYNEPETLYRWVIDNDSTGDMLTEAFYKLGFIVAKKGEYPEAVALFKRAMYQKEKGIYYNKAFDNVQKILVTMINNASRKQEHFSVVELYKRHEKVFLRNIDECDFLYNVALGYLETGLHRDAESMFERVVAQQGSSACKQSAVVCLGRIDVSRGDLEKAEDRLKILLFGRNSRVESEVAEEAYHVLGDIYYLDQRYQKAVEAYAIPLRKNEPSYRFAKSLFRLGVSFGKTGYYYNGIQTFKRMLALQKRVQTRTAELDSFAEEARMLIGDYLFDKGNYETARMMYQSIVQTTPDKNKKGWALVKCGESYAKTGNQQEAIRVFNDVLEKIPYSFLAGFAQARIDEIRWQNSWQSDLQHIM